MTTPPTRQPHRPLIQWAMTAPGRPVGILRYLNDELLAARDAMARPAGGPQPRPQAPAAQDTPAAPATAGKVSAGV